MTLRATQEISGYCTRCHDDVRTVRPWPHWRKARYAYFGGLCVALYCTPVILADGFILIPSLMVFISAIGPLNSLVAKKPTCAQCGAIVSRGPGGPTRVSHELISPSVSPDDRVV